MTRPFALLILAATLSAAAPGDDAFRQYWYHQGAEITRYALDQPRYGAQRDGDAVLVFVTEPLSTEKLVKSDDPDAADAVPGLKVNHLRTFLTGVYPYRCMTTVLQPIDAGGVHALKVTTSVQEWCGHVFEQIERRDAGWRYLLHSYFETEGEQDRQLEEAWLEDELWTRLRLDPASIPTGETQLVPGAIARRFAHRDARPHRARISHARDGDWRLLRVAYQDIERTLTIRYQDGFPWQIEGWTATDRGGTTTATRTDRLFGPYWRWNDPGSVDKREQLGLDR